VFAGAIFFFFFTLVTGPRRSLSLKLSDTRVYEPQLRARLGTTAHFCRVVVLELRTAGAIPPMMGWAAVTGDLSAGWCLQAGKVDIRLHGKGNSNSHGARPVHQIISMIKWIRTSRLSIKSSLCRRDPAHDGVGGCDRRPLSGRVAP